MRPAKSKPSISGMMASSSATRNGVPPAASPLEQADAAAPLSVATGSMPQLRTISSRMVRFVWLSSTTRNRQAVQHGRLRDQPVSSLLPNPKTVVKWNRLPALSTQMRPSMRPTSCALMASPNPVPPYCRAKEPSACLKASKITWCCSGGMPGPVSLTRSPAPPSSAYRFHVHHHLAPLRELDGVASEIEDDLPQAPGSPISASGT